MNTRATSRLLLPLLALLLSLVSIRPALAADPMIKFWIVGASLEDSELYKRLGREFQKQSNVQVEVTPLPWGSFKFKYLTAMAGGIPPDIGITNNGGPYDYGVVGGVVDLRKEFPDRIKELEDRFYPKTLPSMMVGERLYGVPFDTTTPVIYYRTDTFAKLGLKPPKTISEFNHVLDVIDANGYMTYFEFPGAVQWSLNMYTMPYGKTSIHADENGEPTVDWMDPKYQQGVVEALQIWWMHNSPGQNLNGGGGGVFASDKIGTACPIYITVTGTFTGLHRTKPEIEGKWSMITWPNAEGGKPYNIMAGTAAVIFRDSKNKRAAFDWLMYLTSVPVQREITLDHLRRGDNSDMFFSTVKQDYEAGNEAFWNETPEIQPNKELVEAFKQILPTYDNRQGVQGSEDATPLEANFLDQMGSYIKDSLTQLAQKHGISKSELIKAFGQGKFADERANLISEIKRRVAAGYAEITPQALSKLRANRDKQGAFDKVVANIDAAQSANDALKVAKLIALAILAGAFVWIVGKKENRANFISYALVAPPLILALVFVFIPASVALYISLTRYHPVLPLSAAQWAGTENYREIFTSGELPSALFRTAYYTVLTVPVGILLSLVFAYLLNRKLRAQRWWRFVYFSPLVTGVVSVSLIFSQLFQDSQLGWINAALLHFNLVKDPIQFLGDEHMFLRCVVVLAIWGGLAFTILVFLAGLQQVPEELYEAAEMDGAGQVRRFWNIAVPGIRPQVFFITMIGCIGGLQVFDTIYTLAGKAGGANARFGPNDAGATVVPLLYHYGFEIFDMGRATAVAYVLFALILGLTMIQLKAYQQKEA